jgi:hypothetical protein
MKIGKRMTKKIIAYRNESDRFSISQLRMTNNHRFARGSAGAILIIAFGLCALLMSLILLIFQWQNYLLQRQRAQAACEASALAVACEISRIVIDDPNWGFVAIGDQPACGKITMATDGEPIPIAGINTVIASARMETLVARELTSPQLKELALQDTNQALRTSRRLQRAIQESLSASTKEKFRDWNGQTISPYKVGRSVFQQNIAELERGNAAIKQFNVRIGWLENGSTTLTPRPERKNNEPTSSGDFYEAFTNAPVDDNNFYFAGVAEKSRLVNANRFRDSDSEHFSSAVLVEAVISYNDGNTESYSVGVAASAIPQASPDRSAAGSLVLNFPQGTIKKFGTLASLIDSDDFRRVTPQRNAAANGDFPRDRGSVLVGVHEKQDWTLADSVGRAYLDWLKTNHGATRLETALEALRTPFDSITRGRPNTVAIYDFDKTGNCLVSSYANGGFFRQTVSDQQTYDIVYGIIPTEKGNLGLAVRDHVSQVGPQHGGKHAGQPLFYELPYDYDYPSAQMETSENVDPEKCRKSYLKGGLAVSMEIFMN